MQVQETATVVEIRAACPDCGGSLIEYDDWSECEFLDGDPEGFGVNGCGFVPEPVGGFDCFHGVPRKWCAACLGRPSAWVRSQVTGKVMYSPDLISWFVPSALGHAGRKGRGWANFVGVKQRSGALSERVCSVGSGGLEVEPEGLGDLAGVRRFVLDDVGAPEWYVGVSAPIGAASVGDVCDSGGLDWYGMTEAWLGEVEASLLPSGVIEPVPAVSAVSPAESSSMYSGAAFALGWDQGEQLREWRRVTGRLNGRTAGLGGVSA